MSAKIGDGLPVGAVIKNRNATGEILKANAPGRDAIVSRVIWLRGMEGTTANTRDRCIYIHGTAEEQRIGRRASFGCVRMRSKDVIVLYNLVHIGTHVRISTKPASGFSPARGAQPARARRLATNMNRPKILFICVHNSARSQMAEAFMNDICGAEFEAQSAGLEPGT